MESPNSTHSPCGRLSITGEGGGRKKRKIFRNSGAPHAPKTDVTGEVEVSKQAHGGRTYPLKLVDRHVADHGGDDIRREDAGENDEKAPAEGTQNSRTREKPAF